MIVVLICACGFLGGGHGSDLTSSPLWWHSSTEAPKQSHDFTSVVYNNLWVMSPKQKTHAMCFLSVYWAVVVSSLLLTQETFLRSPFSHIATCANFHPSRSCSPDWRHFLFIHSFHPGLFLSPGGCVSVTPSFPLSVGLLCNVSHSHSQTTFSIQDRPEFADDGCEYSWCNKTVSSFSACGSQILFFFLLSSLADRCSFCINVFRSRGRALRWQQWYSNHPSLCVSVLGECHCKPGRGYSRAGRPPQRQGPRHLRVPRCGPLWSEMWAKGAVNALAQFIRFLFSKCPVGPWEILIEIYFPSCSGRSSSLSVHVSNAGASVPLARCPPLCQWYNKECSVHGHVALELA